MDFRENGRAIGAMMLAMAGFILNDTMVKLTSDSLPLGQIIFVRGLISGALLAIACAATGVLRAVPRVIHPSVCLRTIGEVTATLLYLTALFQLPLANATAILQSLPLVVTAGAALFFRDAVGWRRWTAILVGFAGVVLIVRPGLAGFNSFSLFALAGVLFMALRDLATRRIPTAIPTLAVALATTAAVTLMGGTMTLVKGWVPMTAGSWLYLTVAAGFIMVGYVFIIAAMRAGDISVVAPFRYSIVLWAIVLGFLVWGDIPDAMTIAGTLVVVLTGIYTFFRERRLRHAGPVRDS
ncbi:membrane protein [Roseibium aquae]|uniref:Membrane protein n=1 Tax=Roseibium aquae TaxID=1323746 RepID=A0A916TEM8_9HYPH|nr:DMT family transporter [Roseibium aquae]GGB42044.1 membrane protein [Roseibium aquae]